MFSSSQNPLDRQKSSLNMLELHIYVVPTELWEVQQNLAFNEIINETISAGFIRINAETPIGDVRMEIDQTLGYQIIPKDYVFCKSVGRCLAQVQEKQENSLKVKHFLPPKWHSPELFVVDRIVLKYSHATSNSSKTRMSSTGSFGHRPDLRSGPSNNEEFSTRMDDIKQDMLKEEYEEDTFMELQRKHADENMNGMERRNVESNKSNFERDAQQFNYDNEKVQSLNMENSDFSNDRKLENRRKELEELQFEIARRHRELEALEKEHQMKLSALEADEELRKKEEINRRKMFEQMEKNRRIQEEALIAKQREDLKAIEDVLVTKQQEIKVSEQRLIEEKENRLEAMKTKRLEINELRNQVHDGGPSDPNIEKRILAIQKEIEELDIKIKEFEDATISERKAAEREFKNAKAEFENLKFHWNDESKHRDEEYAERISEEKMLRKVSELKRLEFEKRIEEETMKIKEERARFEEEQSHWEEEKARYESEERRRAEEMEVAIKTVYENKPEVQQFVIKDPELISTGGSKKESMEGEKIQKLKNVLMSKITQREESEKHRNEALKKIRTSQLIIQDKRNNIREVWKKRYFEEKRKTPILEEQLNKYKEEIEMLHKKLLGIIETGFKEHHKQRNINGIMSPSNKANLILQAIRIQHDINDLQQKVEHAEMRLSAEIKLRAHTENELKITRIEATQNKIRLSRTRADQLAIIAAGKNAMDRPFEYYQTPRTVQNNDPADKSNQQSYNSLIF